MKIIDFHSHILPGVDHGSSSKETTALQLSFAENSGISIVVATPHFYPHKHNIEAFLEKKAKALEDMKSITTPIKVLVGAEVLICEGLNKLPGIEKLCIEGSNVLLIELPFFDYRIAYKHTIEALIDDGFTVVLAHADRYDQSIIDDLVSAGAKIQLNASSIAKMFPKKSVISWLKSDIVYAIGSDIHKEDRLAYKKYQKAKKKLKNSFAKIMQRSETILNL